ncbi:RluA family pseudouridine synthase [Candidatus Saccharibacteria bacterium]|nr:RluA family pseudouridine synthase [Candidatus Saccharibacteria bacterium]
MPRHIEQMSQSHPNPINQLVAFRFNRNHYYVLFDETAEDDDQYILQQIHKIKSDASGEILKNPTSELMTYGLPFKGKDAYLFQLISTKKRLDVMLAERHQQISRSTWQKHIKAGHVNVNGEPAKSAKQELTDADTIAVSIPDRTDFSAYELPIIYIDDNIVVVDKPNGVLTHSKGALNDEFTVADFFRRYTTVGLDTSRPGIVHRLDRDTSGVIVGARTPESFALLKAQFADRKAKKQYIAILQGVPDQTNATINIPIGRNPSSPSTFRVDSKGKPAVTDYTVFAANESESVAILTPHTGRTHQLRVHMQHIGTPIVGDRVYGSSSDRLYLHAYSLEITTAYNTRKTFTAPIPAVFNERFPEIKQYVTALS